MFVHETHSYYIMVTMKTPEGYGDDYMAKKRGYFEKAMSNIGSETVGCGLSVWMLNEVMYSSSEDVYDIINSEVIRLISSDNAISKEDKNSYMLKRETDKVIISEYSPDNSYVF